MSTLVRTLAISFLLLGIASCGSQPARYSAGSKGYAIAPAPGWVTANEAPIADAKTTKADSPIQVRLRDHQINLDSNGPRQYFKIVLRPLNQAGIESLSQFFIDMVPEYHVLTLHDVSVIRGGVRSHRLNSTMVRLAQIESDTSRMVYRGLVRVGFFFKDVQAGDDVEISWSLDGDNPVFEKRFSTWIPLEGETGFDALRIRVVTSRNRAVQIKTIGTTAGLVRRRSVNLSETTLAMNNIAAIKYLPGGMKTGGFLLISESASWEEVADWASGLFNEKAAVSAELAAKIKEWQAGSTSKEEQARLALEYVQKSIRYVSLSLGENSHRPATPEVVLSRGFGDCKDKSQLLTNILQAMGIEAHPALVSSRALSGVADPGLLPSPILFDHAITEIDIAGEQFWVDPTHPFQAGSLAQHFAGGYGQALATGRRGVSLVSVKPASDYKVSMESIHRLKVVDFHKPVELTATGTRTGWFASELRAGWQMQGRDAFEKGGQEFLRRYYPTVERAGPVSIEDDVSSDRLVSTAEFRLPEYFTHKIGKLQGTVVATNVMGVLVEHPAIKLNYPLPLKYPMNLSQDIIVEFPEDVPLASEVTYSLGNEYRTFRVSRHYENKELHVRYEIRTLKPEIPPEAVKQDNELIRRIRAELRYDYEFPVLGLNNETNLEKGISHAAQQMHKADEKDFAELTAAIRSGRLSGSELAKVYVQRAWSLERLDRYAEALADAKMAETIDPNNSDAVETQAADLDMLRRFEEAEKLYAIVEAKFSDNAEFYVRRGSMYYRQGSYDKSIADLRHVIQIAKTDQTRLRGLIWLLLATRRSNEDTRDVIALAESSAGLSDAWPGPVLNTLLGRMSAADLYLRSQNGLDESASLSQICEAYYFVGQHLLIMGNIDEARQAFEKAVRTDSHRDTEYVYSLWEMQRLGSGK